MLYMVGFQVDSQLEGGALLLQLNSGRGLLGVAEAPVAGRGPSQSQLGLLEQKETRFSSSSRGGGLWAGPETQGYFLNTGPSPAVLRRAAWRTLGLARPAGSAGPAPPGGGGGAPPPLPPPPAASQSAAPPAERAAALAVARGSAASSIHTHTHTHTHKHLYFPQVGFS